MAVAPFFGVVRTPGGKEMMAEPEREPQNNPLDDVAAAASVGLEGQTVSVNGSAARRIDAGQVKMQASSAGKIQAHAVSMENSAAGIAKAGSLEAHDSALGMTIGREVYLKKSVTPVVFAGKVKASEVRTVFFAAGKVQGKVQTVFTIWSALAVGFGLGAALIGLGKLLSHNPSQASPHVANAPASNEQRSKAASRRKNL
jgi:hypothetical protein